MRSSMQLALIMCASFCTATVVSSLSCKTAEDCSLAGSCNAAGQCECFPGFLPPDCGALALEGSQRAWLPENRTTWGGSPIKGSDGTYHLYAAMNLFGDVDSWPNSSVIVHATSARPAGPYSNHSIILGNRSADFFDGNAVQNPVAVQLQDGSVALFYVGLTCHINYASGGYSSNDCLDSANSSLGVAHAPSPYGPWTRSDTSMLAAEPTSFEGDSLANPAAIELDDGSILFAYRGRHDEVLSTATAPNWSGPFTRVSEPGTSVFPYSCLPQYCNNTMCFANRSRLTGSVRDISSWHQPSSTDQFRCLEDPFLMRLHDGSYHMIMHNQRSRFQPKIRDFEGAHAFSSDGKQWKLSQTPAYTKTVKWADGSSEGLYRREEPKLLFEDGYATHLFNAACRSGSQFKGICGEVLATKLLEPIALWQGK